MRAARIAALDDEAQRLSRIERATRPMLPEDPLSVSILTSSPHPHPILPKESRLLPLANRHLSDIRSELTAALAMTRRAQDFHPRIVDLLVTADQQIPGPGMHSAVWTPGRCYRYPFNEEYEAILRPLRYIPAYLNAACEDSTFIKPVNQSAGAHLEGCVKRLARTTAATRRHDRPLGTLLKTSPANNALGAGIAADMARFTQLAVNPAKHDYTDNSSQGPDFCHDDAVYAYFRARRFGCAALQASDDLNSLADAVDDSTRQDRYFRGADLSTGVAQPRYRT